MRTLATLLATLAIGWLLNAPLQAADRGNDVQINARVKSALIENEQIKASQINVETRNAVVQLSGFVDSEQMKEAALNTAKSVRGVAEVRNDLVVRESNRTAGRAIDDGVIAAKVRARLAKDADLAPDSDVDVQVNNGIVQLSGFVTSTAEKTRAADIASQVEGVTDVRNSIALER